MEEANDCLDDTKHVATASSSENHNMEIETKNKMNDGDNSITWTSKNGNTSTMNTPLSATTTNSDVGMDHKTQSSPPTPSIENSFISLQSLPPPPSSSSSQTPPTNRSSGRKRTPSLKLRDNSKQQQTKHEKSTCSSLSSSSLSTARSSGRKRIPSFKILDTKQQTQEKKERSPKRKKRKQQTKHICQENKNPIIETTNWIQCDSCSKWRKVSFSSNKKCDNDLNDLENNNDDEKKWYCHMNTSSSKNKCADSEDDWTDKECNNDDNHKEEAIQEKEEDHGKQATKNKSEKNTSASLSFYQREQQLKLKRQQQRQQRQKEEEWQYRKWQCHHYSTFYKNRTELSMAEIAAMDQMELEEKQESKLNPNNETRRTRRHRSRGVGSIMSNRIKTSSLRRIREIFWDDDIMYHYNDDHSKMENHGTDGTKCNNGDLNVEHAVNKSSESRHNVNVNGCSNNNYTKKRKREVNGTNNGHDNDSAFCSFPPIRKMLNYGQRFHLKKIHDSPHIYVIENFLTPKELNHLDSKIKSAESKKAFQRSFLDGVQQDGDCGDVSGKDTRNGRDRRGICNKEGKYINLNEQDRTSIQPVLQGNEHMKKTAEAEGAVSTVSTSTPTKEEHSPNGTGSSTMTPVQQKANFRKNGRHRPKRVDFRKKQRTSTFIHFSKLSDQMIASIERRAAELLGLPHHCIEPLQIVRYTNGQYFSDHHDMGALFEDGSVELPPRSMLSPPRRIVTIFVYLNDLPHVKCGGSTRFPLLRPMNGATKGDHENDSLSSRLNSADKDPQLDDNPHFVHEGKCADSDRTSQSDLQTTLDVYPKRGRAVLWCNIDRDGMPDRRTVHSGQPVFSALSPVPTTQNGDNKADGSTSSPISANETSISCEKEHTETLSSREKCQAIADKSTVKNDIDIQPMSDHPPSQKIVHTGNSITPLRNGTPSKKKKLPLLPPIVKYGMNIWACEE